jgi:hypothetical protein
MTSIWSWSVTASSNGTADSGINWAEGMPAASVNDSARTVMARIAAFLDDIGAGTASTGSSNAYAITAASGFTAYADGIIVGLTANFTNTGAATLNANSVGAKSIYANGAVLTGGEITSGGAYVFAYDPALNAAAGGWHLLNPKTVSASSLNTGTILDALLPTTFSEKTISDRVTVSGTQPNYRLYESDQGLDAKYYDMIATGGSFLLRTADDAYSTAYTYFNATRSGNSIASLDFASSSAFRYNGNAIYHAGNFTPANYAALSGAAFTGNVSISGTLGATGLASFGAGIAVTGGGTFSSNVVMSGALSVANLATFGAGIAVTGGGTFSADVTMSQDLGVSGDLTVGTSAGVLIRADGSIEIGNAAGAYIDFKDSSLEDYDVRVFGDSTGLTITSPVVTATGAIAASGGFYSASTSPYFRETEDGAAADNKVWDEYVDAGVRYRRVVDDAISSSQTYETVTRSGAGVTDITWNSGGTINFTTVSTLQHNGNTIWTSANDGTGSGLDADLLDGVQLAALSFSLVAGGTNPLVTTSGTSHALTWTAGDISELYVYVVGVSTAGADELCIRFTDDAAAHAYDATGYLSSVAEFSGSAVTHATATTYIQLTKSSGATNTWNGVIRVVGLAGTLPAGVQSMIYANAGTERHCHAMGAYNSGRVTTGIQFLTSAGSAFDAGNIYIYGRK